MAIPRILHLVWVGPHRPPMELIDSWEKKHINSWFFTLWRDHTQGWINDEQIRARANRREWNGVADCMRHEILARFGGFVVDADSECLRALDDGPCDFLSNETAVACYENELVRPGVIGCGFLGAPKGHPFFVECVAQAGLRDPGEPAWKAVGPLLMGRVALEHPDWIKVYPARHFNPLHYTGTPAPGDHQIYAKQYWGATKTYNTLRKVGCGCHECMQTALRPSWG